MLAGVTTRADGPPSSFHDLRRQRLFAGLDDATVERLAQALPTRRAAPGEVVMREGSDESHLYAVLDGELEVLAGGGADEPGTQVALLGPGDWVGEMALLGITPRSATVRAVAPSHLVALDATDVQRWIHAEDPAEHARLLSNIAQELGRRLRVADGLIARSNVAREYVAMGRRPAR